MTNEQEAGIVFFHDSLYDILCCDRKTFVIVWNSQ